MKFKEGDLVCWKSPIEAKIKKGFYKGRILQTVLYDKSCIIEISEPLHARAVLSAELTILQTPNDIIKEIL